jgi:hypothetical protein
MAVLEESDHEEDRNATIKYVLDSIFMDRRFDDTGLAGFLADTIESENGLSEIAGEDAYWMLYYRRSGVPVDEYWPEDWPEGKEFCAGVALDCFRDSPYAYAFMTKDEFYAYLRKTIQVFLEQNPGETALLEPSIFILDVTSGPIVENRKELRRKFRDVIRFTSWHAQIRLVLSSIFEQRKFDQFACLLTKGSAVNCMRGEPGWKLVRCHFVSNLGPRRTIWGEISYLIKTWWNGADYPEWVDRFSRLEMCASKSVTASDLAVHFYFG